MSSRAATSSSTGRQSVVASGLFAIFALSASLLPARAEPLDCDKLLSTDVPFQTSDIDDKGLRSVVKVFRRGDLRATVLRSSDGGATVKKFEEQAGFVLSAIRSHENPRRYSYSIPTNRFVFDQKVELATIKGEYQGKPMRDRHMRYSYLPDGVLRVGSCDVPVKHYISEELGYDVYRKEEIWFSPALMTTLMLESTLASSGRGGHSQVKVTAFSTDFARLPDPAASR